MKELLETLFIIIFVPIIVATLLSSFVYMDLFLLNPYYWTQGVRKAVAVWIGVLLVAIICAWIDR